MRSCIGRTTSFAAAVMMVQERSQSPSGPFHPAHRPAKAKGSSPGRLIQKGCLRGRGESSSFCHS